MKKSYYLSLLILTILICFAFTNNISAIISDDITETYHLKVLSKTYAFYLEQEYFCEKAIEHFPEYKSNINMPRDKFNKKFNSSINNIKKQLIQALGENNFNKIENEINNNIKSNINQQFNQIKEKDISAFSKIIQKRLNGEMMPREILRTLLIYKDNYINKPHREFTDGFVKKYSTKNSTNYQGLDMGIKIPLSWVEGTVENPHVVKEFNSENGNGLESILLLIFKDNSYKELGSAIKEGNFNLNQEFFDNNFKKYLPANSNYIETELINLDTLSAPVIKTRFTFPKLRMGLTFHTETLGYNIFHENFLIQIFLSTSSNNQVAETMQAKEYMVKNSKKRFEKFEPLFRIIANNIVINNVWEN